MLKKFKNKKRQPEDLITCFAKTSDSISTLWMTQEKEKYSNSHEHRHSIKNSH